MPRDVAEFVLRDEALANPLRRYWIEECALDSREQEALGKPAARRRKTAH